MNILKVAAKGFTMLELMIALAISSMIMLGMYTVTSGITDIKSDLDKVNDTLILSQKLQRIIAKDIRMMTNSNVVNLDKYSAFDGFSSTDAVACFNSNNSFGLNRAVSVEICYFIKEGILYRQEHQAKMEYKMKLPLFDNVTGYKVETFTDSKFEEGFKNKGSIFRFNFNVNGKELVFSTGRAVKL